MKGHPIRGFFAGLFLGIVLDLDLALGGIVRLDSGTLTVVLVVCIVVCFLLGLWAPIGRRSKQPPPRQVATPLPRPVAWPESAPTEGSTAPSPQAWKAPPPPPPPPVSQPPPPSPPPSSPPPPPPAPSI
jgi:hypothetical protein